MTVSVTKGEF